MTAVSAPVENCHTFLNAGQTGCAGRAVRYLRASLPPPRSQHSACREGHLRGTCGALPPRPPSITRSESAPHTRPRSQPPSQRRRRLEEPRLRCHPRSAGGQVLRQSRPHKELCSRTRGRVLTHGMRHGYACLHALHSLDAYDVVQEAGGADVRGAAARHALAGYRELRGLAGGRLRRRRPPEQPPDDLLRRGQPPPPPVPLAAALLVLPHPLRHLPEDVEVPAWSQWLQGCWICMEVRGRPAHCGILGMTAGQRSHFNTSTKSDDRTQWLGNQSGGGARELISLCMDLEASFNEAARGDAGVVEAAE